MNKQRFAYYLVRFTKVFGQIVMVGAVIALIFFGIQLYQNTQAIRNLSQSNSNKLDEALPNTFPIKFDTPQNVLREPPLFHLDEPVDVEARFLNETDQPVTLSADVHWVLVTEAPNIGQVEPIQVGLFLTLRPGCTKIPFSNQRPSATAIITQRLFDAGFKKVTWRLTGFNQIIAPQVGGRQQFEVDEFSYIPDSETIPTTQLQKVPDTCETL